ncbi:hypothetical protein ABEB36_000030 [Hypothenemus hampei]|uniref:THAP-type domain-containing protein n=1 Tax=Hypothenemus hampei TaxID=57062 RepID=A0ABD1FA02_HYPHA
MPGTRCCVPECNSMGNINKITMRNLPFFDPEVLAIWKSRIGNPSIDSCNDIKIARNRYREKRLCRDSLPTLNLPNYFGESTEITSRYHLFQNLECQTISANINFLHEENETTQLNLLPEPSTSNIDDHLMQEVLTKPRKPTATRQTPFLDLTNTEVLEASITPTDILQEDEYDIIKRNDKKKRSSAVGQILCNEKYQLNCNDKFNDEDRNALFREYYFLKTTDEENLYLFDCLKPFYVKRPSATMLFVENRLHIRKNTLSLQKCIVEVTQHWSKEVRFDSKSNVRRKVHTTEGI